MKLPEEEGIPIAEAASILGVSTEAVRKRIARKTLRGYKRGRQWFVVLAAGASGQPDATAGQTGGTSRQGTDDADARQRPAADREGSMCRELVEALRDEVAFLREELQARDEELRRKDSIMAALTQRIPELPTMREGPDVGAERRRRRLWWWPW